MSTCRVEPLSCSSSWAKEELSHWSEKACLPVTMPNYSLATAWKMRLPTHLFGVLSTGLMLCNCCPVIPNSNLVVQDFISWPQFVLQGKPDAKRTIAQSPLARHNDHVLWQYSEEARGMLSRSRECTISARVSLIKWLPWPRSDWMIKAGSMRCGYVLLTTALNMSNASDALMETPL